MKGGREKEMGGGGEGKVSARLTSATARYTGTKYRYNNAVQVRVPVRLSVPVHTSTLKVGFGASLLDTTLHSEK